MMTPRTQVEWLDLTDPEEENRRKIHDSDYSRFPVVEGASHQVIGIVQVKDLLTQMLGGRPFDIKGVVRPAFYLPDTVTALRALELFKHRSEPMALVVDEYGDFEGVVTLDDILQSLVGDIGAPGEEGGPAVVRRDDGSWIVEGMLPIDEVMDLTGLHDLPNADSGDFHTLGGFMMARINRIPTVGDRVDVGGVRFEVVTMDGRRVDRVLITPPEARRNTP
jgi:putative hemolysin